MGLAVLLAAAAASAAARPSLDETIQVRVKPPSVICLGLCPNFELRIGTDGEVASHMLWWREQHRFHASPLQVEAFERKLRPLRPAGERRLDASCPHALTADGSPDPLDIGRTDDVEIRWRGDQSEARLTSCAYTHMAVRERLQAALRLLGVDPYSGRPSNNEYPKARVR